MSSLPTPPATIAEFQILRQLGAGGMGCVYLVRHTTLGVERVLKQILPEHAANAEAVRRFFAEARAAARLNHRNVIVIHDCRTDAAGQPFIVLEYLRGVSLRDHLATWAARAAAPVMPGTPRPARGLPLGQVVIIVGQTAAALAAAHAAALIHRDIKPDNIMLVAVPAEMIPRLRAAGLDDDLHRALHVKVLDFGIAKLLSEHGGTGTGIGIGTPEYMAPEQLEGRRGISPQADQYSCGAMAFQLLTGGIVPWGANTPAVQIYRRQQSEPPPDPRTIDPSIPAEVADVVRRAMACNPADRWPSVAAFARALAAAVPAAPGSLAGLDLLRLYAPEIESVADVPTVLAVDIGAHPSTDVLPDDAKPAPSLAPHPTTLGSSVGSRQVSAPPRRRGPMIAGGAIATAIGAVALALSLGGGAATATTPDAALRAAPLDAGTASDPAVDAAPIDAAPPTDAAPAAAPPTDAAPIDAPRRRTPPRVDASVYIRPV